MSDEHAISAFATFVDALGHRALVQPDATAFSFLRDAAAIAISYRELDRRARAVAAALQAVATPGARAILLYPPGIEFIAGLFGCLYSGVIPVPAYPPVPRRRLPRVRAIIADAQPTVVLTAASELADLEAVSEAAGLGGAAWLATDRVDDSAHLDWRAPAIDGRTLALLQYTSGSTATPKGVMVSHRNLLHNSSCIRRAFALSRRDISLSWLPSFHDMGLIDGVLQPIYSGFPAFLMAPTAFLQQPLRWLQEISDRRVTHSGGPDFAYALCVRKTTPAQRAPLDLGCWAGAYNGAEPIRHATLHEFAAAFAPCGFQPRGFFPCYGLAEATLMVTGGPIDGEPVYCDVGAAALERHEVAAPGSPDDPPRRLVGCGRVHLGTTVVIADPASGRALGPDQVGEIWIAGPSVAGGYWERPDASAETFGAVLAGTGGGPFLRSGDLGFLRDGELFVTGRLKDLVIVRGRNHYPQDLELTAERSHPALRAGCSAAFAVARDDRDELVIACEVERSHLRSLDPDAIAGAMRRAVAEDHDIQVHTVVLLKIGGIPKTSSGKIQRSACRRGFLDGTLDEVGRSALAAGADGPAPGAVTRDALLALPAARREAAALDYVAGALADALRVSARDVLRHDSLLALGLDSLTAIELQHRLASELGVAIAPGELLQAAGAHQLAAAIVARLDQAAGPAREEPAPAEPPAPAGAAMLSRGQQALWFLHQTDPASTAYNVAFAVRVRSELRTDRLRDAFAALAARHDALRTTFPVVDGRPVARLDPARPIELDEVDAAAWSERELADQLAAYADRPFDLERGPLWRGRVFRRAAADHVVLLGAHHIVADLSSLRILLEELLAAHRALAAGQPCALPPTGVQPAEHAAREAAVLRGPRGDALWAYWQRRLAGPLPIATFPADRRRPAIRGWRGAAHGHALDAELVARLRRLAAAHGATPYMLALTAFCVLLHRYTGQPELAVGSAVTGRDRAEVARTIGYFVNQVVVPADLRGDPRFDRLLAQVADTVRGMLAHQEYPFSALVERLAPERDLSHAPLVQTLLVMEKAVALPELERIGGLPLAPVAVEPRAAQVDVTLRIVDAGATWRASWEYSTELFDPATIERIAGHFEAVLRAVSADPARPISQLALLSPAERHALVVAWNRTERDYPRDACVHQLFEAQVDRDPAAIAVVDRGRALSYRELDQRANQLAHHLRRLGVGVEHRVGVCMARCAELVVAVLGILKAGAAYVPLDPSYPALRLRQMLDDAAVAVRITCGAAPPAAAVGRIDLDLEAAASAIAREPIVRPAVAVTSGNLAYVIYTSGSTGAPRGAMVGHRSVVNYLSWCCEAYAVAAGRGAPVNTSIAFDATVTSLFAPLAAGAQVVLLPEAGELPALVDELRTARDFSLVKLTPVHLDLMRAMIAPGEPAIGARALVVGGEALDAASAAFWRAQAPATRIINEYGPTEATVGCCVHTAGGEPTASGTVPIGRPIANARLYLLDGHGEPVPIGATGEIYIGGDGLARGYLARPGATAARFVPDPFSGEPGARLYRTGDLARRLPDHTLEFLGRIDDQLKLRGFRVEPGEIAAALLEHPAVADAVVIAERDAHGTRLVAYVVARGGEPPVAAAGYRAFLAARLPHYMVPAAFVALPALPLTPNGKVDRRALPPPGEASRSMPAAAGRPATAIERVIAEVWRAVLRLDAVGSDDNFFELGGHSLLAVEVKHRLERELGRDIPLVHLLQHPTVGSLATSLEHPREVVLDVDPHSSADSKRQALRSARLRARRKP